MDKYQSSIGLGVILLILGVGILVTGWMISETDTDRRADSQDYYTIRFGLPQTIIVVGVIPVLAGVAYAIHGYRAERLRKRRPFCPYCGREVGTIQQRCTGCGGRL